MVCESHEDSDYEPNKERRTPLNNKHYPSSNRLKSQHRMQLRKISKKNTYCSDDKQLRHTENKPEHKAEVNLNGKKENGTDANNNQPNKDSEQPSKTKGNFQIKTVGLIKRERTRKFKYEFCKHVTDSQKELNTHHIANHDKVRCAVCSESFNTPCALHRHKYRHSDSKFVCEKCGEKYPFKSQLEDHMKKHRTMNTFFCHAKDCKKSFKNESSLKKHVITHDGTMHQCPVKDCSYLNTDICNVRAHQHSHSDKLRYSCQRCGKNFKHHVQMSQHFKGNKCEL